MTKFKIRLPDDQGILMRRFRVSDTLQVTRLTNYFSHRTISSQRSIVDFQTLFDYLSSEGQFFGEYKLFTTYPKRDVSRSSI